MAMSVGSKGTAEWANSLRVGFKRKSTTDSVTNSTTLVDDAHIVFNLDPGRTYKVEFFGQASGPAAADVKIAWAVTGGAAALTFRSCIGPGTGIGADVGASDFGRFGRYSLTTNVPYGLDGTSGSAIFETFLVETTTSGTAGTVKLRWAQNTLNVTATQLTSATYATLTEVEAL